MANGTYIGTVVVDEIGYKYTLVPAQIAVENEAEETKGEIETGEKVFLNEKDLLAELPAPLNSIPYLNPAIFPCVVVIEEDEEHGKDEVTIESTESQHNNQPSDPSDEITDS